MAGLRHVSGRLQQYPDENNKAPARRLADRGFRMGQTMPDLA
jgi:hypothetical protein